jgi:hypothetical protein
MNVMRIYFKTQIRNYKDELTCLLIGFFVIVGTFPENDWSFSVGIDSPLKWVFNHLFDSGLKEGRNIIFPHGPLAFFLYPLQENILPSVLVNSMLKGLMVFNIFWMFKGTKHRKKWWVIFLFPYLFSIIAGFNHLILINILLLYCNYYLSNKRALKFLAFFITAFAFYVKAYVAIISGMLFIPFVFYYLATTQNKKQFLLDTFSLLGFILLFWILMYGTFNGFVNYLLGMYNLALDNSSAAAYYPHNNWMVLSFFLLIIISIFVINRTKKAMFYGILIALGLFAAWKHGMAREDIYHVKGFLIYTIICLFVFIVFNKKNIYATVILSITALFLLTVNMKNSVNYFLPKYELFGVNNFLEFVTDFPELKQEATRQTGSAIASNQLPQHILDMISNSTLDVYPWDYSIVAANGFNWQPRVVIQSYASYTTWLDRKNAEHFDSKLAPEYLIWEQEKVTTDVNGGQLNSIDNRYLLNDEPESILHIISNYEYVWSDKKFRLFKKRKIPISRIKKKGKSDVSAWGEWIDVPESGGELLRARLNFSKNTVQSIKSFFYKDEQFWIYLKLHNGSIHKYRIVPKNAKDGLWINPYVFNAEKSYKVEKIMFVCSNRNILTKELAVDWEQIEFENEPKCVENFFGAGNFLSETIMLKSVSDFEQPVVSNWSKTSNDQLAENVFGGLKSHRVKANSFSSTFRIPLDSIPFQDLKITADCWVNSPDYQLSNNISLVLSVDNDKGNIIWKGLPIDGQLIDEKQWNNIFNFIEYQHKTSNCTLSIYVWNTSNEDILIDDFRVMILLPNAL